MKSHYIPHSMDAPSPLSVSVYQAFARAEMEAWLAKMKQKPSWTSKITRGIQDRINRVIPEKVHQLITAALRETVKAMVTGAGLITPDPLEGVSLEERERRVKEKIAFYNKTAAAEGAVTGAGGILLGLADFPLWLSIKMKLLLEIAALYGHPVKKPEERAWLLYVFQLAFSSQRHKNRIIPILERWKDQPVVVRDPAGIDWRSFQLEYRDYIDLAKMLQLVPGIGAAVGFLVNHRLTDQLGETAIQAYRLRYFQQLSETIR